VLFLNQLRSRLRRGAGEPETTAGGEPLKLQAAVRLALIVAGSRLVRLRALRNKLPSDAAEALLAWRPGTGFVEAP
jgi:hypothetical protein